ncbi:MAG TPA: helicase C-terminal domain-containing protein [Anaerolineales bacterium]|nr:helicase C-terminal domain-containing protein [Anaerolineales bacterium]HRQ91294.1 helicase C-terminal domain-containing protein [Anaerolineales bacterium]
MPSIVALDIETTGIDSQKDAIIEIGAVRFDGQRIEGEWHSLVNPGRRIPPFITQLTGINDNMVRQAPSMRDVAESLAAFVGEAPILGQRISFDLSFLRRHNLFRYNDSIDTYDVAAVLMPGAGRYNLGALGQQLNVAHPATHRALDDAKVTQAVYAKLYERMLQMPLELLAEITRLAESQAWGGELAFRYALRQRSGETAPSSSFGARGPIFVRPERAAPGASTRPRHGEPEEPQPLDLEEAASLLQPGGGLASNFENFEHRSQQVEMLRAVGSALSEGHHLLVEAGTGTGKSMAYLLPSALFALQNDTRVVISTNTINLQDQLIHKDIPDLQRALGQPLQTVVLKGRNNYLCPRRLMALRRRGPENAEELRVLAKVLVWLESTQTGDRGELNLNGAGERAVWGRISAADENCGGETCVVRMGGICPFHRAYQAAENAHLVVVNHALLLADVATGNRVLPEYQYLVVDEAHHIEAATTSALSFRLTQPEVERILKELGGSRSGQLGRLLVVGQQALQPTQRAALETLVEDATDRAFQFQNLLTRVFSAILHFLNEQREALPQGDYTHQERIVEGTRTLPAWLQVETAWEDAQLLLQPLLGTIEQIQRGMKDIGAQGVEELEDLAGNIGNSYRSLSDLNKQLQALVFEPQPDIVYWVELNPQRQTIVLNAAPLHVGALMEEHIWHKKTSAILTSATLTTAGEFDYIKRRLHAIEAEELALGSPFDYESAAMLYLVEDMPEPAERHAYQASVERGLIELAKAANGRTLALFTSYEQLRRTSRAIAGPLRQAGIELYEQGEGASPHALLENFKNSKAAVLLGTRAFWEGVDIPGDALSVVAIVRLPFDVPSDPLVAARSETFESPFYEYQVPEAILRFRQGFGRLIRTQYDRGVVAIFDKRLLTKQYGALFIDSLPPCTLRKGRLDDLPRATAQWLGT